jgi:hypothetical protein
MNKIMAPKIVLFNFILITSLCVNGYGQSQEKNYATFILNFSRGMVWPSGMSSEKFVIGVMEYPPLAAELINATQSLKIGNRKIEVKELSTADDANDCQIVFIPAYKAKSLPTILSKLDGSPTLIVTNKFDLARRGSGVNFVLVDGKLQYEINARSIEARGLKISAGIKGMGIEVN